MVDLEMGRTGVIVLLAVFVLLTIEDVLVWIERGAVPGIEFFLASVLVVLVLAVVVEESLRHRP